MKKLFFILLLFFGFATPLCAQWCGRPCTERYYNPEWSVSDSWYYGYTDINAYPYALPVNYCFNPRPCPSKSRQVNYDYMMRCIVREQPQVCPHCNGMHE